MSTDSKKLLQDFENLSVKAEELIKRNKELEQEKVNLLAAQSSKGDLMDFSEKKLLASFGAKDISDLLQKNVAAPQFNHVDLNSKMAIIELKKELDIGRYISQMFYHDKLDQDEQSSELKSFYNTEYAKQRDLKGRLKAFGSTVSGGGDEWVPTALSNQYIEEYVLEKQVAGLFMDIKMPTNPYKLPVKVGSSIARLIGEGAAATDVQGFQTADLNFDSKKLYDYYLIPEELNEDSAPNFLEIARADLANSQLKAMEQSLINGDLTAPHMDSDVTAASDCRKAWKGLRKAALENTANGSVVNFGSAITELKLLEMKAAMQKFGVNPKECALIVSTIGYNQILALDKTMTVDKVGAQAVILSGALAAIFGFPIIVSEFMRDDLTSAGIYDGVTMTKTACLLVNHRRFWTATRRPVQVRVARDPRAEYDRWQLVTYARRDFKGMVQSASETSVVYGVNITV